MPNVVTYGVRLNCWPQCHSDRLSQIMTASNIGDCKHELRMTFCVPFKDRMTIDPFGYGTQFLRQSTIKGSLAAQLVLPPEHRLIVPVVRVPQVDGVGLLDVQPQDILTSLFQ